MDNRKINILITAVFIFINAFFLGGCKQDSVSVQSDNLDFSAVGSNDSISDIPGLLVLNEVKVLIKDIKLNVSNSSQDSTNFKTGPYVLYLHSGFNVISTAFIPAGTYDKVRFMIHKLEDNENIPDPDFADVNGRYSVVVKGTYDGVDFLFKSDKSAHQKLTFPNSLLISETGKSNITLKVYPYIWFISGGLYLNPSDSANRSIIENNIKENINANIKIFVDNDKNGIPD